MNKMLELIRTYFKKYMERSRFFNKNTTPKIVSIIFALVMWLYVMGDVNPERMIPINNVNVQLLNVEELKQSGLVILGQKDYTVNVKISGRINDLYKIGPEDIIVRADLEGFPKGVNSVPLEITGPANITIEDVSPKLIKVTLDEIVKRQKPVVVQTVGTAAEGFEPSSAVVSPSEVIVEGPESIVNTVTSVVVEVNLDNSLQDIKNKLPLRAINSEGKPVNGVEIKSKYVEVSLPIYKIKEVPIVLDVQGAPQENFIITQMITTPELVVVKGSKEVVDKITEIRMKGISIEGINKSLTQDIELILPEGVEVPYLTNAPKINITVEEVRTKEFDFSRDEIAVDNLEAGYVIDLHKLPETIKVQVEGISSVIQELRKQDIQIYLNAKGLLEGKYSARLLHDIPMKVDKVNITPSKVDFEIKTDKDSTPANTTANTN